MGCQYVNNDPPEWVIALLMIAGLIFVVTHCEFPH